MSPPTAWRETTVSVRGVDLFVRERGAGHPLLIINGLGGNVEMLGPLEQRLSAFARTVAFDAPGTGRSSMPAWPLSVRAQARMTAELLDELEHDRFDVLGFSLGGLVAQELARARPSRVRRLALVATACGWGSMPGTPESIALAAMPLRYHSRALYERTQALMSRADAELVARVTALREARLRFPPSILAYMWQLWASALWSSLPWLPLVQVPTLVVHGSGDELVPPANAVQVARLLPNSRLHILAGEGHLLLFDPDGGTHPLLADFFAAETLEQSQAWATGLVVDHDETVAAAFATSIGDETIRAMSGAFEWYVRRISRNGKTGS